VFWGDSASEIHHVAFLYEPVDADDPEGDWYLIEARGVMYGVVRTRLLSRKPDYWGWMTRYFDYGDAQAEPRVLENGMSGDDVRRLQEGLIRLGYDLGRYGADGDFGDATEQAVEKFQKDKKLPVTGIADEATGQALEAALARQEKPVSNPRRVRICGGNCYVREKPSRTAAKLGVAHDGDTYPYAGQTTQNGWIEIEYKGKTGWVSGKYARLIK
jgi:peptidoglycan hydrolase-like protein with peptidoglycan-binding domain